MTPTEAPAETEYTGIDQHPEGQDSDDQQPQYGPNGEQLPEQLIKVLKAIVESVQSQDGYHKYLRRMEVMRSWQNRLYDRGIQHIYWTNGRGEGGGGYAVVTPGGLTQNSQGQDVQAPRFVHSWNIVSPYMSILTAVQTQDPPDIVFRPENANETDDINAAKEAEGYRDVFDRRNDVSDIDKRIFRMLALDGRVVTWTRTETDSQKFGYDDNGEPKRFQTTEVFGTIESRVPILANGQGKCYYCALIDDLDVRVVKSTYGDWELPNGKLLRNEVEPGCRAIGESAYERMARLGVMQNTGGIRGNAFSQLCARANWWLRPASFEDDEADAKFEEGEGTCRDKLKELFPMGVHITFIGDNYVGCWAESMDDCLTIRGGPLTQDGMFQMALCDPIIVVQDALNDGRNTAREIWDVGWPSTWWAAEEQEYDAAVNQRADPYAIRLLKDLPQGQTAEDRFYREPDPTVPEQFAAWLADLGGPFPQFQLGAPPSLFGGVANDKNDTAAGLAQAKQQALGMQGLTFKVKEEIWASIYRQAAMAAYEAGDEEPLVAGAEGKMPRTLDMNKLARGKFLTYPDRDSGFPETTAAKRQIMQNTVMLAGQSPMGQQIFDAPQNARTYLSLNGISEMVIPEAEAGDKQLAEIEQLLKNKPVPPDPQVVKQLQAQHSAQALQASETGQPIPPFVPPRPKSTITPDPLDFHLWEFNFGQDWLSGPDCRRQLQRGNMDGVNNVRAHLYEHWDLHNSVPWQQPTPMAIAPPKAPPAAPGIGVPRAPNAAPAPTIA